MTEVTLGAAIALWVTSVGSLLTFFRRGRRKPYARKIVIFTPGTADAEADRIVHSMGGRVVKRLPSINGALYELNSLAAVMTLSADHRVTRVDDDLPVHAYACRWLQPSAPPAPPQPAEQIPWGVTRLEAPAVWDKTPPNVGAGVKVAVLDTGADLKHPDLSPNLAAGVNILDPRRPPADDHGHGTHVTGILAAARNRLGVVGVAPGAKVCPVKVLDREGGGSLSDIVQGLEWCAQHGIRVVNLSLGSPEGNASFAEAVANAAAAGIVIVAAAGNSGPGQDTIGYPARYPQVVAVAATTFQDSVADYSSRGTQLAVAAPGDRVTSTWLNGGYEALSGTSMAAPHVAGLVALLLAAEPGLTPAQVRERLKVAAVPLAGWGPEEQGAGLVNAPRTLARSLTPAEAPETPEEAPEIV